MSFCIVSGADQRYFQALLGLIASVAPLKAPMVVLNLGLTDAQVAQLTALNVRTVSFTYPFAYPARAQVERDFPGFGAMLARPHLSDIITDFDILMWMDADTWAQDPAAVHEIVAEARLHGMAAVPEIDRSYFKFTTPGYRVWDLEAATYERCFGPAIARHLRHAPVINSGVWAAQRTSPVWAAWQRYLQIGLERLDVIDDQSRIVEQAALNAAIEVEKIRLRRFPAIYNWMAYLALPAWHGATCQLVDPNPPYMPLKIVHITTHLMSRPIVLPLLGHPGGTQIEAASLEYSAAQQIRAFLTQSAAKP